MLVMGCGKQEAPHRGLQVIKPAEVPASVLALQLLTYHSPVGMHSTAATERCEPSWLILVFDLATSGID